MKISKPAIVGIIVIVIAILAVFGFNMTGQVVAATGKYDSFAQCLSQSGVKMYGAYWCPHCNEQKSMFGSSWQYVNYVECSLANRAGETPACTQAGITAYPTWEFQDGSRVEGALTLEELSTRSGCPLG
jgi:hypothetical protein